MLFGIALFADVYGFHSGNSRFGAPRHLLHSKIWAERKPFELEVPLGSDSLAQLKFKPLLDSSEVVVVKCKIPFGLSAEPKEGKAVVTADGDGGEKIGDILRFCTHWYMGQMEGSGLLSTVGNFGGAPSWRLGLFDVAKASTWQEVIEALTSNEPRRGTDTVTLIFERPLDANSVEG